MSPQPKHEFFLICGVRGAGRSLQGAERCLRGAGSCLRGAGR